MKLPTMTLEKKLLDLGYGHVVGVDEVGMGCLAGPVVVCAVSFSKKFYKNYEGDFLGVTDSKLLSPRRREEFARKFINEKEISYSISVGSPKEIDLKNIYQTARSGMTKAVTKLMKNNLKVMVLVDGNKKINSLKFDQRPIVKGDQKIFIIACASVIAKVYRDKLMERYAKQFPDYGFEQHKGYSTKAHQKKLKELGPCPIHRRSFRLVY